MLYTDSSSPACLVFDEQQVSSPWIISPMSVQVRTVIILVLIDGDVSHRGRVYFAVSMFNPATFIRRIS